MAAQNATSARAILEPYFVAVREEFLTFCLAQKLGTEIRKTKFECRSEVRDSERHFAATTTDGRLVVAAPDLADLPEDTVGAILAHEFGHVVDHLYPGRFLVAEEEGELIFFKDEISYNPKDERTAQVRVARMRQWEARSDHEVELTADLIVEQVLGHRVGYSGLCMLQGFNRGVRRPKELR